MNLQVSPPAHDHWRGSPSHSTQLAGLPPGHSEPLEPPAPPEPTTALPAAKKQPTTL